MEFTHDPFGLHTEHMDVFQMCLRGITVFIAALILLRIAGTRTMGKQSAFDHLTLLIIGSILGRSVVTGMNFFGVLVAVLIIVLVHRFLAWITFKSKAMGTLFKGDSLRLIIGGQQQHDNLAKANISEEDFKEALHKVLSTEDFSKVREAYLERSGEISFVKE